MNLTRYSVVPRKIPLRALQWWVLVLAIYLAGYRWVLNSEMLELPSDLPAFSSTVPLGRAMGNLGIGFVFVGTSVALAVVQLMQRHFLYTAVLFSAFALTAAFYTLAPGFYWSSMSNRFMAVMCLSSLACLAEYWLRRQHSGSRWSVSLVGVALISYYVFLLGMVGRQV